MLRLIKKQYRNLLHQKERKGQQRRCMSQKDQRKNQNRNRRNLPKLSVNHDTQAGHSIFAHSRPDKIGTPRLLPLYIRNILNGISAKKSAQILCPALLFLCIVTFMPNLYCLISRLIY